MIAASLAQQHPEAVMWGYGILTFVAGFVIGRGKP